MADDNLSGFGVESADFSEESAEAQFISGNICGKGASCTVYRMRLNGLQVAVKRLSDTQLLNAAFISAYRKEFEIGRRLKHDALPVYRDLRVDSKEVYIVMDFVDGVTVDDFLVNDEGREYFNDEENLRRFLLQLLDAVAYLHRSGVIHCDVKPANIMLRNSDRAVMLIDLDKAYCDTYDLTHGGTPGISDVVGGEEKPSAGKDFAAIGRVLDIITGRAAKAASRKFRRFRHLCDMPDISVAKLRGALSEANKSAKTAVVLIAALVNITLIVAVMFLLKSNLPIDEQTLAIDNSAQQNEPADTVASEVIAAGNGSLPKAEVIEVSRVESAGERNEIADFDSRMARYIEATESATADLRSGKLSDSDIQKLASRVSDLYFSIFDDIRADYKREFPDASESDAYLALTTALGNSRTFKIMQAFNQEVLDTVNARLAKFDASNQIP
jgi:tRNA A-37 threonylcarbamoyl transferase component Bud32